MKISYQWLQQHMTEVPAAEKLDTLLTQLGLEVEGVTHSGMNASSFEGLVAGEVKECVPHPNADKLKLTKVDAGTGELLRIVCGAPNVAEGQKVVVATVGTILHPVSGEPFKIKKSKIRGEESNGMLCAEDEIGLGTSHAGIIVLPSGTKTGTPIAEVMRFEADALIEIGITPNHADACSHLGVARELRAILNSTGGNTRLKYDLEKIPSHKTGSLIRNIRVDVADQGMCPRYAGLLIGEVSVGQSPEWLQKRLRSIGLKPINTLVDISNYVLHDIGQPIHIFDADKIAGDTIVVRSAKEGEMLTTLDGIERKLKGTELMICDAQKPLAIAGVFGGLDSGVSATTKNIFIESAYFNPASVRRSARAHALNTDASFRFERGTDPDIVLWALHYTAQLVIENAGGTASVAVTDTNPKPVEPARLVLRFANLSSMIGKSIPREDVKSILAGLNINILTESEDALEVTVPPYKNDVVSETDLIEEVLRVHGLNNIPLPGKISTSLVFENKTDRHAFRESLANNLSYKGYNEIMTNSLIKAGYPEVTEGQRVPLLNPLSNDLGVLRDTLLYSGLEVIAYNLNRSIHQLQLFELGRVYKTKKLNTVETPAPQQWGKEMHGYREEEYCAIFITGRDEKLNALQPVKAPDFYHIKSVVAALLGDNGIDRYASQPSENKMLAYGLSFSMNTKEVATFGAVSKPLLKKFDIGQDVFYAEINMDRLVKLARRGFNTVHPVSKFPAVRRDLSLLLDEQISFADLEQAARKAEKRVLKEVGVFDIYKGDKLGQGKKSYALYFTLGDDEKTLDDRAIHTAMERIQQSLEKELGAVVR
jgi:phenylalanyl-tRNA synthetase beta chain